MRLTPDLEQQIFGTNSSKHQYLNFYGTSQFSKQDAVQNLIEQLKKEGLSGTLKLH